jgi:rhodanese-related sulfurtransferase
MLVIVALGLGLGVAQSMVHFVRFPNQPIRTEMNLDAGGTVTTVTPVTPVAPSGTQAGDAPRGTSATPGATPDGLQGTTTSTTSAGSASNTPATTQAEAPLGVNITVAQAFALYQKGEIFLDSRRKDEYEAGHVDGSLHLSTEHFGRGATPVTIGSLDKARPVIVYCGGGACDASKNLVIMLQNFGFTRFHIMTDGFPAWQQAGHPVAIGPSPIDPEEAL